MMSKILVTGAAGFIGFHLVKRLLDDGHEVFGLDSINDYYDVNLKYDRLLQCGITREAAEKSEGVGREVQSALSDRYRFARARLEDHGFLMQLFQKERFEYVVHLAAQAGVRYSLTNPHAYTEANITGFLNILEACRHYPPKHLVYASSSSVYGSNTNMPFSVTQNVDHPVSLYAASKKANELMAHTYSHLFGLPATGLRFFTVYGPWGRPDMALFIFTKAILENKPIELFNHGNMMRDFTYVSDIIEGIVKVMQQPAQPNKDWNSQNPAPESSLAPWRVYNIGNSKPVQLTDFVKALETALEKKAICVPKPMQAGDVPATWADTSELEQDMGYKPATPVEEGIRNFVGWYREYYDK
jgi:UDP-glucuronate 4-epimerase